MSSGFFYGAGVSLNSDCEHRSQQKVGHEPPPITRTPAPKSAAPPQKGRTQRAARLQITPQTQKILPGCEKTHILPLSEPLVCPGDHGLGTAGTLGRTPDWTRTPRLTGGGAPCIFFMRNGFVLPQLCFPNCASPTMALPSNAPFGSA